MNSPDKYLCELYLRCSLNIF